MNQRHQKLILTNSFVVVPYHTVLTLGLCSLQVCLLMSIGVEKILKQLTCILSSQRVVAPWLECLLMVRWVVGSILHGVDPLSYFSFQPVIHNWYNKGSGMCHPVCGMMHIKEPLLLIGKSSPCGGSGFPLSLSEWSFTICLTPYNCR